MFRDADPTLLRALRLLEDRVKKLEDHDYNQRHNSVRVGDVVISWDGTNIVLTNLKTNSAPQLIPVP